MATFNGAEGTGSFLMSPNGPVFNAKSPLGVNNVPYGALNLLNNTQVQWNVDNNGNVTAQLNFSGSPTLVFQGTTNPTGTGPGVTGSLYFNVTAGTMWQLQLIGGVNTWVNIPLQGGGGGGSVTLQVNGTPNSSQTLLNLISGSNISITDGGSGNITIANTANAGPTLQTNGTTNSNQSLLNLIAGSNVSLAYNGAGGVQITAPGAGSISATTGPSPWVDIQAFGAKPRVEAPPSTTGTTTTTSSNQITLANKIDIVNGDGITMFAAGNATTQSTPSAPTVSAETVASTPCSSGNLTTTYNYKVVGIDANGGLTAASAAGSATGPAILGAAPVTISSAVQVGTTLTVTFSSNINAVQGQQICITGFATTDPGYAFCGYWPVATAPAANQITITMAGSAMLTGGVTSATTGRLTNATNITAISRSGTTITITTNVAHGVVASSGAKVSVVIVNGVTPTDLNGWYVVSQASGTTLTCFNTGITGSETGSIPTTQLATATVYEFMTINVGQHAYANSPSTVAFYVYGDYGTGTYQLIGKTGAGLQTTVYDFGPWFGGNFQAPSYVPTTPPNVAQNQMYSGIVQTGGGTTSITVSPAVPSIVTNATLVHDEVPCINLAQATLSNLNGGQLLFSCGTYNSVTGLNSYYTLNSPLTVNPGVSIIQLGAIICNETVTIGSNTSELGSKWVAGEGPSPSVTSQFGSRNYAWVLGIASPLVNEIRSTYFEGLLFSALFNNTWLLQSAGYYTKIRDCGFSSLEYATIPLVYSSDGGAGCAIENCEFSGTAPMTNSTSNGQVPFAPPGLPCVWIRGNDSYYDPAHPANLISLGSPIGNLKMYGNNSFNGRGILYDGRNFTGQAFNNYFSAFENQAATQPFVMMYGAGSNKSYIQNVVMDSSNVPVVGVWSNTFDVAIENVLATDLSPVVTGYPIYGLRASGISVNTTLNPLGQNYGYTWQPSGNVNPGPDGTTYQFGDLLVAKPLVMMGPDVLPIAFQRVPPVLVSASATGSGSVTGTFTVAVTAVGWNGGESQISNTVSVTASSQTVVVTWTDVSYPVQGYNIYLNAALQNASPQTGTTYTITSVGNFGQGRPTWDGTGLPLIDQNQVASSLFRVAKGNFKTDIAASTLTANRTINAPDASGTLMVGSAAGVGNGGSTNLTALAQGSGSGPASDVAVGWTQLIINGATYWIPLFQ